jgi:N-acylglucosamine 2-epimerase
LKASGAASLSVVAGFAHTPIAGAASPKKSSKPIRTLAGKSLADLREEYRYWLFDDFLPFMDAHIIDHEFGGFMCNADRDGTLLSTEKRSGFAGRGLWIYSHLYRTLGRDSKHLEVARKALDFLLRGRPKDGSLWPPSFTKDGSPLGESPKSVNTELYIAEGIAGYASASGDKSFHLMARDILFDCLRIYDTPGYLADSGKSFLGPDAPETNGVTLLDDFMLFLRLATRMLEDAPDLEIAAVAKRCADTITNNFYNPGFGLLNEMLGQDLAHPPNDISQLVTFGNIFQALWHTLDEAVRRKDGLLFTITAERLRRHIEVAWDDVYGGLFGTLRHVDDNIWETAKINYVHGESLNGLLMVIEHAGEGWACDWFDRIHAYTLANFPLRKYGFPLWNVSADRKMTFVLHANRVENYHHPRHLMLSLAALDRIVKRGGRVSGVFS